MTRVARALVVVALAPALFACGAAPSTEQNAPRSALFIGIDVSGSFQRGGRFDDGMAFISRYIHAHLNGAGGLEQPRSLFVAAIGGAEVGEAQAFRPIHDFQGKSVQQIEGDLRRWYKPNDQYTDFNAYLSRVADHAKRLNLTLAPITIVMVTDGEPDMGRSSRDEAAAFHAIELEPLEYLARNVTLRVLYPDPPVAVHWEKTVERSRVRVWTTDHVVMRGWRAQVDNTAAESAQPALWDWISDNVDFRVRRSIL